MVQTRHVNYRKNSSLAELYISPETPIAFYNSRIENTDPFVIAIPDKLVEVIHEGNGHNPNILQKKLRLKFNPLIGDEEEWILYFSQAFELWPTSSDTPVFDELKQSPVYGYIAQDAYSGIETVQTAFANTRGFGAYANCMKDGRLSIDRSSIGKLAKKLGFDVSVRIRFH